MGMDGGWFLEERQFLRSNRFPCPSFSLLIIGRLVTSIWGKRGAHQPQQLLCAQRSWCFPRECCRGAMTSSWQRASSIPPSAPGDPLLLFQPLCAASSPSQLLPPPQSCPAFRPLENSPEPSPYQKSSYGIWQASHGSKPSHVRTGFRCFSGSL